MKSNTQRSHLHLAPEPGPARDDLGLQARSLPYSTLIRYKQWGDRGLHQVVGNEISRLDPGDASIVMRILDHIHVVDRIFQHHLQGLPSPFQAPRSERIPALEELSAATEAADDWYVAYVAGLSPREFDETMEFRYSNGSPARMTRGEMILHVCLHGTYHRGNAGILLQKTGIVPNDDRMTDFLEAA